jgi:predicted nucleotidyltransferase
MNNEVEIAKKIITEEIEKVGLRIEKILLFGSRARGDYTRDSDWDFYVIIDREIPFIERRKIITCIRRRLAKSKIPNDIIIQSVSTVERRKNDVGYLSYYVLKEGIEVL